MNPNNLAQRIIELEKEIEILKENIEMSEQEIKEINLSNQMEISSYTSQTELEEIENEVGSLENPGNKIKINKLEDKTIHQELIKIFKI
jgi:uncharacterized metal-binding protein